jgi:importin-13
MDEIARAFLHAMVILPAELSSGVLRCAIQSLSLQERYSLVGSCKFLVRCIIHPLPEQLTKCLLVKVTYIKGSMADAENLEPARACLRLHGQEMLEALVLGIVGEAPRSSVPNLATVLATLVAKLPSESREWLHHTMLSVGSCQHRIRNHYLLTFDAVGTVN